MPTGKPAVLPRFARRALAGAGLLLIAALAAGCGSGPPKESVSGTIRLSPSLPAGARQVRHLFIYLEPGGGGPPFAIQRLVETALPYRFVITPDDVFAKGRPFAGQVRVRARLLDEKLLDPELEPLRQGKLVGALMKGCFEGVSAPVAVGARDAEVVISQAGTAEPPKVVARKLPPSHPPITQAPPQGSTPPQASKMPAAPQGSTPPQAPAASAPGGASITGTIVLAPPLASKGQGKRALFLIAWSGQPGPPLAVVRIADPKFPLAFKLSQDNVMMPGVKFAGRVRLVARVDVDGSAGPAQKGDLEGQLADVAVGSTGVRIVVDKEY